MVVHFGNQHTKLQNTNASAHMHKINNMHKIFTDGIIYFFER